MSEPDEARSEEDRPENGSYRRSNDTDSREDVTRTFLRIDGMHSITCESFLEAVAEGCDGVTDAEASYVTETIRIDYDPGSISQATLCDALNIAGYTAIPREDAPIDSNVAAEQGERRLESALGYRYAAGVIFGSFLLLPYIVLLYPAHLSSLLGEGALQSFAGGAQLDGGTGVLILPLYLVLTGVILFFTGLPLLRGAYVSLKMRAPNAELLTTLTVMGAYLYSTVAVLLGRTDVYFDLTIVIAAIVVAAIFYESLVKQRAMDLLTNLTLSQIDEARRYEPDGTTKIVAVDDLQASDRILVREGERIPVDGILTTGECTVEEAVITGESLPIEKQGGDDIVGGSIVTADAAVVSVADRATSSIEQLITTVWNLQSADHGAQRQANQFAARSIPIIVAVAVIIGGTRLALDGNPVTSLLVALTVLLVASPWAFGLATPLSVATSIEEAMRRGIVVFDETIFERLRDVDVIIFDKTGTLTTGQMSVIEADAPAELLEAAAMLERRASHPAADAIVAAFAQENEIAETTLPDGSGSEDPDDVEGEVDGVREFSSHSTGVEGVVNGTETLVGHPDLFEIRGWSVSDELLTRAESARGFGRLPVLVGRDGNAEGFIVVGDEPRERWDETITRLSEQGIEIVVLTGDDEDAARFFGRHPHVDYVFAGVPPAGKTATVRRLQSNRSVTMVGDGTNDAPALAQADLGISLGSGTALASDAADIAIVDDDLTAVETAFDLARAARQRIRQNNVLALLYNGITIPLAAVNLLNPLLAMAAVIVSSTLLAANSVRALLDS
ncbi:heavy metal translocating P-type ATPase [Halocatena marina]|uniref:heavy metal translocating P-type ATPase n=1 Tax=Halocatena marina TaxID=2934937 RepID=UPI00200DCF31|nr:cation-translocating P-type ATPase [Halocatena marina]